MSKTLIFSWFRQLWSWIIEPRLFWLCVIVLVFSLLIAFRPSPSEFRLRTVGLFLQLCGIGTVAWGLGKTRKLFGKPAILLSIFNYIRRFPPFPPKPFSADVQFVSETSRAVDHIDAWLGVAPEASIEKRVSVLERNLEYVNRKTIKIQEQLDSEIRLNEIRFTQERLSREKVDKEIHQKLVLTETGGLHLSLVGIFWLSFGLILSTIPNELIRLFS